MSEPMTPADAAEVAKRLLAWACTPGQPLTLHDIEGHELCKQAADLLKSQAREIERLRVPYDHRNAIDNAKSAGRRWPDALDLAEAIVERYRNVIPLADQPARNLISDIAHSFSLSTLRTLQSLGFANIGEAEDAAHLKSQGGGVPEGWRDALEHLLTLFVDLAPLGKDTERELAVVNARAMLAASPPPPEVKVAGWQPIETAPKDRTVVLLYQPYGPGNAEAVGQGHRADLRDHAHERWVFQNGYRAEPTHWMPLPSPPVSKTEGDLHADGTAPASAGESHRNG